MNLSATIELHGGGPGSGCRGADCGRPSIGKGVDVFYHGTVLPSAKAILKEGLKPHSEKTFKTGNYPPESPYHHKEGIPERKGYVYVTSDKEMAMTFAAARAAYDAAKPGEMYEFKNYFDGGTQEMWKKLDAPSPVKGEVPAIVELEVPKNVASKFQFDEDFSQDGPDPLAQISKGVLPKEYIKNVTVMKTKDSWIDYKPEELAAGKTGVTLYLVYYGPLDALKKHLNAGAKN